MHIIVKKMFWKCVYVLSLITRLAHSQNPVANTQYGDVEGTTVHIGSVFDDWNYEDIDSFLGIPFAADTGQYRFQLPQAPQPWSSTLMTKTLGTACPNANPLIELTHPDWDNYGEDCLHVNIAAPTDKSGGPYPVMVFIHGGAFISGANIQYPGYFLASRGVVYVSVNYRLGNFGFTYSGTDNSAFPGNAGLHDQVMALEFVRDNIDNFGGDPNRVTVFGQSAGAASTSMHIVSPKSKHLFHQAMMESGTESSLWSLNWPEQEPWNYVLQLAEGASCYTSPDPPNWDNILTCMQAVPWDVLDGLRFSCKPGHFCMGLAPVVDGAGGFLPELPEVLRESGDIMKGNIITGLNRDDGSIYTALLVPSAIPQDNPFNRTDFQWALKERLLAIWEEQWDNATDENIFQAADWNYSPWDHMYNSDWDWRHNINEFVTDGAFGAPMNRQALDTASLAEKPNVFTYLYGYRGENTGDLIPEWMGVPHMLEVPYVFGLPLLRLAPEAQADSQIIDIIDWTDEDIEHAKFFLTMITNFAKFGDPTPMPVVAPTGELVIWPQYVDGARNSLYISNSNVHTEVDWHQKDYAFFHHYFDYLDGDSNIPMVMSSSCGLASDWFAEPMKKLVPGRF